VFADLLCCVNNFIRGKASILHSFADLGDVDAEINDEINKAIRAI